MKEYKRFQEGVVKSILARPDTIVEVIDHVDVDDFEDVNFKVTYKAIIDLFLEKRPISLPDIALKIGESGGAINTSWLFNLESNISDWVQAATPSVWARLLKRESAKFQALEVLKEGIAEINKPDKDPLSEMDEISSKLSKVSLQAVSNEKYSIEDAIDRFHEQSKEISETGGKLSVIQSAYPTIDSYTQGWASTHLITVGARTGVGKSVFAINNAVSAIKQGKSVYFFSLEMTEREVLSRMIASLSLIPIKKIENAEPLTDDELERFNEAVQLIKESKLVIDDNPHVNVEYIKRSAIKQSQSENGLDFIIIDYLQLIGTSGNKRSRQEEVASVSREMKVLAKELNVPVMVLVQLLRERRDDEGDQMPKLYEIRESGAIAQDSNVVILIHRSMDKDPEIIDPKAVFFIAKNRQGESNRYITVRTRLESSLFLDENQRGQDYLYNLANADSSGDNKYELNHESTEYDKYNFENEDESLFNEEEGFGEGEFGSELQDSEFFSNDDEEYEWGD